MNNLKKYPKDIENIFEIEKYFWDIPLWINEISTKMNSICLLDSGFQWEKIRNYMINNFINRVNDWFEHEWTIFWLIRLIKDWIEIDIFNIYKFYLGNEMNEFSKPLRDYFSNVILNQDKYPREAIIVICNYVDEVDKRIRYEINQEMEKARNSLWFKENEKFENTKKNTKRRLFWLLPA